MPPRDRVTRATRLYYDPAKPKEVRNVNEFLAVVDEYPYLEFFRPDSEKAPYHVQVKCGHYTVNLWPHTGSAHINGRHPVKGFRLICEEIEWALDQENADAP